MRIAVRDMRGRARSLWLLVAGVFIGTAAVALVATTLQSLIDGARQGALESIGGDLSLRLTHRPPSRGELAAMAREGAVSLVTELRTMAYSGARPGLRPGVRPGARAAARIEAGDTMPGRSMLIELKGVGPGYPSYGALKTRPTLDPTTGLGSNGGQYGAVADAALLKALGLEPGDDLLIGGVRYRLRGELLFEPDRAFRAFTLGPRVIVANASLKATGLVAEGAAVYHYARIKLPPGTGGRDAAQAALARIDRAFPQSGWRLVNAHDGVPGVERTLAMAQVLLLFIGLGVMLVGGAGIFEAVRAHASEKMVIIAILKSLGASPGVVTLAMGLEVMAAALLGAALGVGLGAFGPALLAAAMADQLPFQLNPVPGAKPLMAAALFGVLVAALFAWWPLVGVRDMRPRVLLRQRIARPTGKPSLKRWLGAAAIASAIVALVFWVSPMPKLTMAFLAGALALAALYHLAGQGLSALARRLARGKGAHLRLVLGNLHRAGAPTGPVIMALGLSLTLLVALDGIGTAASHHVRHAMPATAPDLVAFSLVPKAAERLSAELAQSDLVHAQRIQPFLHARVQAIKGVAVRDLKIPASMNWVIRGDRGVSIAAEPGADEEGALKGFSMDAAIAGKLGIGIGDTITLNIGGAVRQGPVTAHHNVDWTRLDLDFPIIAAPGMLDDIPHSYAAALKAHPGAGDELETLIKYRFPGVPLIRVADVLRSLATAMETIVSGLRAAALTCGLAALVVLAGSVLQGTRTRTDEAVLLKVLGARRGQLLRQLAAEFLALGTLVALVAVPLGLLIAHAVADAAGLSDASLPWSGGLKLALATTLLTVVVGLATTARAYRTPPARNLRDRMP